MRKAKLYVDAVCVVCPHCDEPIPNRANGSISWCSQDFMSNLPIVMECQSCGKSVRVVHYKSVKFEI